MVKENFDISLTQKQIQSAEAIITTAHNNAVTKIINVGTSVIESKNSIALAKTYAPIYAAIGIHPNDCTADWKNEVKAIRELIIPENKVIAIGEIGLDTHYPDYNLDRQKNVFRSQIEIALQNHLPIIVHSRQAPQETLAVIDEYSKNGIHGIIHCFSENSDIADEYINRGFYLGIGGTVTYPKNQYLRDVVLHTGLKALVLETDAPYLAPQTFRGKQNHPMHIKTIALFIAELLNVDFTQVAQQTTKNVYTLFNNIIIK